MYREEKRCPQRKRSEIIKEYATKEGDTGSPEGSGCDSNLQNQRSNGHLRTKDYHSEKRSLTLKMVRTEKEILKYILGY